MTKPRWGRYSTPLINTSSTLLVAANPHRRVLRVSNPSGKALNISFGAPATAGVDFTLQAQGVSEEFTYEDFGGLLTGDIFAVIATSATQVAVIEGFEAAEPGSGTVGTKQAPFGMS